MTEEQLEGNKLIAEFMGAVYKESKIGQYSMGELYVFENAPTKFSSLAWNDYALRYHSSWDWLMPVVEKIEKETDCALNIFQKECWLADEEYRLTARGKRIATKGSSKIEAVWLSVVEFIKWYNQNKN